MRLTFSELTLSTIRQIVNLHELGVVPEHWEQMVSSLSATEELHLQMITKHLVNYQLTLMNEATIWSRAVYPLLLLAETNPIQAWAQVLLKATYPAFALEGAVDGVLGNALAGTIDAPYLIVVEAKRGLEAQNPQYQLYGSILAAAWQNQQQTPRPAQEIYGCYTIGDTWTFVQAIVTDMETAKPALQVLYSREYTERLEGARILQILKYIVQHFLKINETL